MIGCISWSHISLWCLWVSTSHEPWSLRCCLWPELSEESCREHLLFHCTFWNYIAHSGMADLLKWLIRTFFQKILHFWELWKWCRIRKGLWIRGIGRGTYRTSSLSFWHVLYQVNSETIKWHFILEYIEIARSPERKFWRSLVEI